MSATQQHVTTTIPPVRDELELSGSSDMPRQLLVERDRGYIYACVYRQRARRDLRAQFQALAHNSSPIAECSIMTGSCGSKSLLVGHTHYPVTDAEARKIVERFGLREWS